MLRFLRIAGLVVGALLLVLVGFWFWASSGSLSSDELRQTKSYNVDPSARASRGDTTTAQGGGEAARSDTLSVMTYNIGYLSGMTNNQPVERDPELYRSNLGNAITLLRNARPDIIGFQEIDFGAERSFGVHQLDTIARQLGYANAAQAVNWDVRYLPFPYGPPSVHFGHVVSGQAVLTSFPIASHERTVLAETSRPYVSRVFYIDRLAQGVDLVVGQDTVAVLNIHLEAFEQAVRVVQAREVREIVASLLDTGRPVLLIGDFNAVPGDPDDPTLARVAKGLDLKRAVPTETERGGAVTGTYPADAPGRLIDHIFYSPGRVTEIGTKVACGPDGAPPSDHCAVTMRFTLTAAPADSAPADSVADDSVADDSAEASVVARTP